MTAVIVVGCDPGPIPGLVGLLIEEGKVTDVQLAQCTPGLVGLVLGGIVMRWKGHPDIAAAREAKVLIGVERFVVGRRASRSSTPQAGAITRDMVGVVTRCGQEELGAAVVQASASQALPWSTDERLEKAGIVVPKGMVHAKSAARHALYTAVKHGYLPDPMSRQHQPMNPDHVR